MRTPRLVLALPAAALLLVAGCGGTSGGATATGTTTASPPATSSATAGSPSAGGTPSATAPTTPSSTAGAWGHMAGCPSVGRAVPAGATSKPTVDVDGDGRADTAFITPADAKGVVTYGVRTASGGVFTGTLDSPSPDPRSVLFADVTGHGEVIALVSDGRMVDLYAVSDCQLVPEKNPQGQDYVFSLGFTDYGTGVGCIDADGDGTTDLVGLDYVPEAQGAGTIRRTIVVLTGPRARNGATDTVPATRASMVDEAHAVTCGDLTMTGDGVSTEG